MRRPGDLLAVALTALLVAGCLSSAERPELAVFGPYIGPEADLFAEVIDDFERQTGAMVRYTGSAAFSPDLARRISSGALPDVVFLPQPGTVPSMAAVGRLTPLDPDLGSRVLSAVGPGWEEAITWDGEVVGVPYRLVVKSLVWYRPDEFAERGFSVPATLDDLEAVSRVMRESGVAPWCAGMDDYASSGWWGTDWVEDLVIRQAGADVYRAWSRLDEPFDGEAVVGAIGAFDAAIGLRGNVVGGRGAVSNTLVTEAMAPMFTEPAGCLMLKQASFQSAWLPAQADFGDNLDVFPLPSRDGGPAPIVIGGEIAVITSTNPAAHEFVEFLLSEAAERPWEEVGGSLSPRAEQDVTEYRSPLDRRLAEILEQAPVVVFDASDLMPREIGSGAFWQGMIDLVAGRAVETVAGEIQTVVDGRP